jgi:TctA family transporter
MFFSLISFQEIIKINEDETFTNVAKQAFLFYGVLLAMERIYVYGKKIVLKFLLVLVFFIIIRTNEDKKLENEIILFAYK